MSDVLAVLTGALCTALGIVLGRYLRIRREPKPVQPVCGCRHHYALHERGASGQAGACKARETEYDFTDADGRYFGKALLPCPCPGYYGPEPLPEYVAREISG